MLTMGLDLDEKGEPTAIAVVQTEKRKDERGKEVVCRDIWFMERLSEGGGHEAMERMAEIVDEATHRNGGRGPMLYVNVTGPGKPGLGALRFGKCRPPMTPVYLTEGDEAPEGHEAIRLGKGWLVFKLQELLRTGCLHALDSATAGAEELGQELENYRPGDEPGPLMITLGLAVQKDWSGVCRVIIFEGPGSRNPYRNLRAEQAIRDSLDTLHWEREPGDVD